jgi:hypothetical protein
MLRKMNDNKAGNVTRRSVVLVFSRFEELAFKSVYIKKKNEPDGQEESRH